MDENPWRMVQKSAATWNGNCATRNYENLSEKPLKCLHNPPRMSTVAASSLIRLRGISATNPEVSRPRHVPTNQIKSNLIQLINHEIEWIKLNELRLTWTALLRKQLFWPGALRSPLLLVKECSAGDVIIIMAAAVVTSSIAPPPDGDSANWRCPTLTTATGCGDISRQIFQTWNNFLSVSRWIDWKKKLNDEVSDRWASHFQLVAPHLHTRNSFAYTDLSDTVIDPTSFQSAAINSNLQPHSINNIQSKSIPKRSHSIPERISMATP